VRAKPSLGLAVSRALVVSGNPDAPSVLISSVRTFDPDGVLLWVVLVSRLGIIGIVARAVVVVLSRPGVQRIKNHAAERVNRTEASFRIGASGQEKSGECGGGEEWDGFHGM
jgi:hypothetical protein